MDADEFLREAVSQLDMGKSAVMTVGRAQHIREFLLDVQPSGEKMDDLMALHNDGLKLLTQIGQAIVSDVDNWQAGLKAAEKARDDEVKARAKEQARLDKLQESQRKRAEKAEQRAAARAAAKAAAAAAENGEATNTAADRKRRKGRTNLGELDIEQDRVCVTNQMAQ